MAGLHKAWHVPAMAEGASQAASARGLQSEKSMLNEADTCRKYVVPRLQAAGWDEEPHSIAEQRTITDGRIVPAGKGFIRKAPKRVDYLLRYTRDFPLAVVEAKAEWKSAGAGMQQAKDYAEMLGLKFAYATNGHEIVEFDYFTGPGDGPSPTSRHRPSSGSATAPGAGLDRRRGRQRLLTPMQPRGRQGRALLPGDRHQPRGRGDPARASGACCSRWRPAPARPPSPSRSAGSSGTPAGTDRASTGARASSSSPTATSSSTTRRTTCSRRSATRAARSSAARSIKSREMYFAIYQALAEDERRAGPLPRVPAATSSTSSSSTSATAAAPATRATGARSSNYFEPAYQLGMTATPLRDDNRDTYLYFGNPIYPYSLRQGIDDGFLAPYRVHRVVTEWDAAGWRPSKDELDRYGRAIPDDEYQTKDFERRGRAARPHRGDRPPPDRLPAARPTASPRRSSSASTRSTPSEMRAALNNLNADLVAQHPDYVCRVTADEGRHRPRPPRAASRTSRRRRPRS